MPDRTTLPLTESQQRDVTALLARRGALERDKRAIERDIAVLNDMVSYIGRTVISSAGHDPDVLGAAGWDLDLSNAATGVVMTPPPEPPTDTNEARDL